MTDHSKHYSDKKDSLIAAIHREETPGVIADLTTRLKQLQVSQPAPIQSAELADVMIEFGASLLGHASDTDALDSNEALAWVRGRWLEWQADHPATPAQPIADVSAPTDELAATDAMVDAWIKFASKATYLQHPKVAPYEGTANGDSAEAWHRRYVKAAINEVLAARAAAPTDQSPYEPITLANLRAGKLSAARMYVGYCELSEELKAANGAIKRYEEQARAASPVSGPSEVPNALGYVPSDDILLPFMSLVEDYMSAVDYHGSQNGEKCVAAEAAIRAALVKLAASHPADNYLAELKLSEAEIEKVRAAKRVMVDAMISSALNYGACGVISCRLEEMIAALGSTAAPVSGQAASYIKDADQQGEPCASILKAMYAGFQRGDSVERVHAAVMAIIDSQSGQAAQEQAVSDETALRDAVAESLRGNYYCGRVWSAWGVGTMGEDDFSPSEEVDECIDQVMDAIRPFLLAPPAPTAQPLTDAVPMPSSLTPAMKAVLKEVAPKWNAESIYSSLIDAALPDAIDRQITLTKESK